MILGSERFVERYQGLIEAKREFLEIPRPQRYVSRKNIDEIFYEGARQGTNRDELIYRSHVRHGYTMKEIADYLEVHYVSVSRSIKRYENKREK
jgi:DNA-directed RNA polymerase specialized sigma subunit